MKKNILYSVPVVILGGLISFGPQYLFKACSGDCSCCGEYPQCFWATQAEIGMGLVIAALGLFLLVYPEPRVQVGLLISIFLAGIVALLIPHVLIGGCEAQTMACHRRAYPALTIESALLLGFSAFLLFRLKREKCGSC